MKLSDKVKKEVIEERDNDYKIAAIEIILEKSGGNPSIATKFLKLLKEAGLKVTS